VVKRFRIVFVLVKIEIKMNTENPIVLFDGDCPFCSLLVKFIIFRDHEAVFKFASISSSTSKKLAEKYGLDLEKINSLVLIENGKIYTHSTATLRICRRLKGWHWKILYVFILVPQFLRDFVYKIIARNRYKLFKEQSCFLPTNRDIKKRFLS
jgi:predicted DCC family thiol-disulfide oxidoreductase YuxK